MYGVHKEPSTKEEYSKVEDKGGSVEDGDCNWEVGGKTFRGNTDVTRVDPLDPMRDVEFQELTWCRRFKEKWHIPL